MINSRSFTRRRLPGDRLVRVFFSLVHSQYSLDQYFGAKLTWMAFVDILELGIERLKAQKAELDGGKAVDSEPDPRQDFSKVRHVLVCGSAKSVSAVFGFC